MAATGDAPFGPTLIVDTTALRNKIVNLKEAAEHLQSHIEEDEPPLGEMHEHVGDLDAMLGECVGPCLHPCTAGVFCVSCTQTLPPSRRPRPDERTRCRRFHEEVQKEITKWRRWDPAASTAGDPTVLPYGLIVTVGVDGFVDGFLIGVTCVLSSHGGVILALATCIEMCFLGAPHVHEYAIEGDRQQAAGGRRKNSRFVLARRRCVRPDSLARERRVLGKTRVLRCAAVHLAPHRVRPWRSSRGALLIRHCLNVQEGSSA